MQVLVVFLPRGMPFGYLWDVTSSGCSYHVEEVGSFIYSFSYKKRLSCLGTICVWGDGTTIYFLSNQYSSWFTDCTN